MEKEIIEKVKQLEEKYAAMGQSLSNYLDGLLYANFLPYWDYIHLDTLLCLQRPKTDFPDEMVFVMYHQITELYFKLALHELEQIANNGKNINPSGESCGWNEKLDVKFCVARIGRVNRYFEALTKSFDVMVDGMDPEQFLRFRMALLPASGFQSAQYRMIEICCTDFINLVDKDVRKKYQNGNFSMQEMFENIYWKKGATELATGKKTLTLEKFEEKYSVRLIDFAEKYQSKNLWRKYQLLNVYEQKNTELINALRQLDVNVNVNWPLVHYKSAVRYLQQDEQQIAATGGTNWQKYLPPRFQKRIFYPDLWSEQEKEEWGKGWVVSVSDSR